MVNCRLSDLGNFSKKFCIRQFASEHHILIIQNFFEKNFPNQLFCDRNSNFLYSTRYWTYFTSNDCKSKICPEIDPGEVTDFSSSEMMLIAESIFSWFLQPMTTLAPRIHSSLAVSNPMPQFPPKTDYNLFLFKFKY